VWPAISPCRKKADTRVGLAWRKKFRIYRWLAARSARSISGKLEQGDDMFRRRRSLFFKKMQIVRGCDAKRQRAGSTMVYSDRIIEGSPKNSTSSVPIMPWGAADSAIQKCGDFIQ